MNDEALTLAVLVNDEEVLQQNLLLSPGLLNGGRNQLVVRRHAPSASLAYNSAIEEAKNDIIVFVHQDVYLPGTWFSGLAHCLRSLGDRQMSWGVLGCFGSRKGTDGGLGRVYTNGLGWHGRLLTEPEPVDTLDEILLVVRKSSGLRFDPRLPHFHLYGTDICMTARERGLASYAFQGSCVHNTKQLLHLPREFYGCYRYIRRKWSRFLPIHTSCIKISFLNEQLYRRRIVETRQRVLGTSRSAAARVHDPRVFCYGPQ